MGLPYRVLTASMIYAPEQALPIYDDAVDQVKKTYERTLDPATGLNRHAPGRKPRHVLGATTKPAFRSTAGRAPEGWYTMALVELLDALPEDYARRGEVIELLTKTFDNVIKWQDKKTDVWYQVMDSPTRKGNYLESTASSMFAYSLLKAARKGWVGRATVTPASRPIAEFLRNSSRKILTEPSRSPTAALWQASVRA